MWGDKSGPGNPAVHHLGQIAVLWVSLFPDGRRRALGLDRPVDFLQLWFSKSVLRVCSQSDHNPLNLQGRISIMTLVWIVGTVPIVQSCFCWSWVRSPIAASNGVHPTHLKAPAPVHPCDLNPWTPFPPRPPRTRDMTEQASVADLLDIWWGVSSPFSCPNTLRRVPSIY